MPKNKTVRTPTTAMKLDMDDKPEENGAEDQGDGSADQNGTKTSSKKGMLISADSDRIVSANFDELRQKFIEQGVDTETAEALAKEKSLSGVSNGTSLLGKVHGPRSITEIPKDAKLFTYEENGDVTELEVHVKAAGVLYDKRANP